MPADADSLAAPAGSRTACPADDDPRVAAALQEYQALLESDGRPDRAAFLARFPDLAGTLAEAMDGLDFLCGAMGSPAEADGRAVPVQLGDFRILREVGRGGMGVVYEAVQESLGRRVALKVLPFTASLDDRQLQRFRTEAQAAAHLHHTNIVPVFAVGSDRGVHYYAMQFIDGQTLAGVIRELRQAAKPVAGSAATAAVDPAAVTVEEGVVASRPPSGTSSGLPRPGPDYFKGLARIGVQAAEALEYAHSMGVVHRDIKPANLLVDGRGNVWVTDFGLAHVHGAGDLTATGDVLGTLRYMSPEQAEGRRGRVDHYTDIYSLGVSLYELFTLREAFPARDRAGLLRQILNDDPPPPRRHCRGLPVELETVILKAMAKRPADRYATAQELAEDLRRFLDDKPILAKRPTLWQVGVKWARRHSAVVGTAVAAGVLLLMVLAIAYVRLTVAYQKLSDQQAALKDQQAETEKQKTAAEKNEAKARNQAARADRSAQMALDALNKVALDLADKRLKDDREWGKRAENFLNGIFATCRDLATGNGGSPELRLQAVSAARQVAEDYANLGRGKEAKKAYADANEWNRRLVREHPKSFVNHVYLAQGCREYGLLLRKLGESRAAAEQFQLALDSWNDPDPMSPCPYEASEANDNLGDLRAEAGDRAGAERYYQTAYELRTRLLKMTEGSPEGTLYVFTRLVDDHLRLGQMRREAGDQAGAAKRYGLALELADKLVQQRPKVGGYGVIRAKCLRALGDLVEVTDPATATEHYRKALEALPELAAEHPGQPQARQLLAHVHAAAGALALAGGRAAEAADHFRAARDLFTKLAADLPDGGPGPGLPGYNENELAWFLVTCPDPQFRDPARAVEVAQKAVNRAPQHSGYLNTLGAAYYRAGGAAKAVATLEKAVELNRGSEGMDWLFLAAARWQLGRTEQAREARAEAAKWLANTPGGRSAEWIRIEAEVDGVLGHLAATR
ncbi:MAG TPA: serine/threonine-protein kinase [Gemmataceae bacterium]|jgi:hypothetical protein